MKTPLTVRWRADTEEHSEKLGGSELALHACRLQHLADVCFYFNGITPKAIIAFGLTSTCGEEKLRAVLLQSRTQHDYSNITPPSSREGSQQDILVIADLELQRIMTKYLIQQCLSTLLVARTSTFSY